METQKALIFLGLLAVFAVAVYFWVGPLGDDESQLEDVLGHKNIEYVIEGKRIKLVDGVAETEVTPDSAAKTVTNYFGNELKTDLNNDGQEDVVFILTQETGGSGTFFYVVAALNTESGYIGSDGYLLGDRIAPQTIELSQNPRHRNVVVVNYADRKDGETMTADPSVGKSVYLKLDAESMQWGIVEPNFEGEGSLPPPVAESWGTIMGTVMLGPTCPVVMDPPEESCADRPFETTLAITTSDQSKVIKEVKSDAEGKFRVDIPAGTYAIRSSAAANILPYCNLDQVIVPINDTVEVLVSCDSGIR